MAASRNWVTIALALRTRWRMNGAVLASVVFALTLGALNVAQPVFAAGETYTWASKDVIHVSGGIVGQPNPVIDYFNLTTTDGGKTFTSAVISSTGCEFVITINGFSGDHSSGTVKSTLPSSSTYGEPLCTSTTALPGGKANIANSAPFWQAQQNNAGCPGSGIATAPAGANYPCPDGGAIVKGVYYPNAATGKIEGTVTRRDNAKTPKVDGCRNSTINVLRLTGAATGDTSVSTDASGKYSLLLGAGTVTLSTPDCKDAAGNTYTGTSKTLTVTAHAVTAGAFEVSTPVNAASDSVCDNATFTELNFWVCGFINLLSETAEGLDSAVLELLKIDTDSIFNDSGTSKSGSAFFVAWAAFRNIAYAILVLFSLVMIASQILGLDMVDAYTFRKMLPRLIIATILIAISWNALDFVFNLSNDAADAIRAIIAAPFKGIDVTIGNTTSNEISLAILIPLLLTIGVPTGVAALALLGVGGIAALVGSIVLAAFSAWVLLVGRNIVADLLIIMSPIAIIFWAFGR